MSKTCSMRYFGVAQKVCFTTLRTCWLGANWPLTALSWNPQLVLQQHSHTIEGSYPDVLPSSRAYLQFLSRFNCSARKHNLQAA